MTRAAETLSFDAERAAAKAGLSYVSDEETSGISRRRRGTGFSYRSPEGELLRGQARERVKALAIPPAWTDVWIAPDPTSHILATGRDDAGRKQYIYHPDWREFRDRQKYRRMRQFAYLIPKVRQQIDADLRAHDLGLHRAAAAAVCLIDKTGIRVGNREYMEANESYGLTTLKREHISITTSSLHLKFPGKSGRQQEINVSDRRIVRVLSRCLELESEHVVVYLDDSEEVHRLDADDVNFYLEEISGAHVTAKDFRLWSGTVRALQAMSEPSSPENAESRIEPANQVLDSVASYLGNTRAICREHYVHPQLLECCGDSWPPTIPQRGGRLKKEIRDWLSPNEQRLVRFLETCE